MTLRSVRVGAETTGTGVWTWSLPCGQPLASVSEQNVQDADQRASDWLSINVDVIQAALSIDKKPLGFGPMIDPVTHQVTPFCRSTSSA
jgi:hypothetical protein